MTNLMLLAALLCSEASGPTRTLPMASCPRRPTPAPSSPSAAFTSGWPSSAPNFNEAAMRLNLEAAALYKQGRYNEAASKYRGADAADPNFLAPRLNLAGLLVRQDKYDDAAVMVERLLQDGFVPWYQEAREATDLAALWASPGGTNLLDTVARAAQRWGTQVAQGVLMLSRLRPPIRLAPQDGSLALFPQQEIVSWNPRNGRFHQVTAENGRVLAFVRGKRRDTVLFVTATKARRRDGRLVQFEGVSIGALDLGTMQSWPAVSVQEPAERITVGFDEQGRAVALTSPPDGGSRVYAVGPDATTSAQPPTQRAPRLMPSTTLTLAGVQATSHTNLSPDCRFSIKDDHLSQPPAPIVRPRVGKSFILPSRLGLSLGGLPLAGIEPPPAFKK